MKLPRTWKLCYHPELVKQFDDVISYAKELGYDIKRTRLYVFKSSRNYGLTYINRWTDEYAIGINAQYLTQPDRAINTIVHEIAHAITPNDGHGFFWQKVGDRLGKKWNTSVSRLADDTDIPLETNYKYFVKCPCCNIVWAYERCVQAVRVPNRYRCNACKKTLETATIDDWKKYVLKKGGND